MFVSFAQTLARFPFLTRASIFFIPIFSTYNTPNKCKMEDTQTYRLDETTGTMEITLHHVDGQNIVYWEDIERAFPGVKRIHGGNSVIKFLRGSDYQR
jgi:hypothetical protein